MRYCRRCGGVVQRFLRTEILRRVSTEKLEGEIFLNGILTDRDDAARLSGYHLAAEFRLSEGDSYYTIHNPTKGAVADLWEAFRDKIGWTTVAAQELSQVLTTAVSDGRQLQIVAHSQGGAMLTEAIRVAYGNYGKTLQGIGVSYHSGANNRLVTNMILKNAGVTTFGGLQAPGYRDAPNDLVPQIVGFNWLSNPSRLIRSLVDFQLLFSSNLTPAGTASPHTYPYKPGEGLVPKSPISKKK